MNNRLWFLLCTLAALIFTVVETTATLPQVAIQNLPLCAQACLTSAFMACPCPLLDLTCACTCSTFPASIRNCTQSSCSPSFVPTILNLISGSCETAISRPAASSSTSTSAGSLRTLTGGSVTTPIGGLVTTPIGGSVATSISQPAVATLHTTLPLTTYINPGSTGTGIIYGKPTPCPSQTKSLLQSDCGPTINPSSVAVIMFIGAAGANYTLSIKLDNSNITTHNPLSISTIASSIDIPYLCNIHTVDYPPALVEGPLGIWAVGPPQTVLSIACGSAHISALSKLKINSVKTSSNLTNSSSTSESYVRTGDAMTPLVCVMFVSLSMYILM